MVKIAEDTFKNLIFAFVLMSLFGILILSAVSYTANTYSKDTSNVLGGSLSILEFNKSISDFETNSRRLQDTFNQKSIWTQVAGIVLVGIVPIAISMFKLVVFPFALVNSIMLNIFGIPAIVTSVIGGLLALAVILAIWRLLKVGD